MRGKFVIIDGPDGAGKSHGMSGLVQWAKTNSLKLFDLYEFAQRENRIPSFDKLQEFDVLLSCEPTLAWVGKAIKEELIRSDIATQYSGISIAQAFAIDREILYRKLLIPALKNGKLVFQERGFLTSFVYQPLQIHIPLSQLMSLPGNKLAMKNPPDLVIICTTEPEYLIMRIRQRNAKSQIFEKLNFLRKVHQRYKSSWLRELLNKIGTSVAYIDTSPPKTERDTVQEVLKLWEGFNSQTLS